MDLETALAILNSALAITSAVSGGKVGDGASLALQLEALVAAAVAGYQKQVGQPMDLSKYKHQDHV